MKLFSHIATKLGVHPENLATEALAFILANSPSARASLGSFCSSTEISFPSSLSFSAQARDEKGRIPDLSGVDEAGTERILIEAKFWAGLTDNQPVEYLRRLSGGPQTGLLLFIAPEARVSLLWPELRRRCVEAEMAITLEPLPAPDGQFFAKVSNDCYLLLTSWRQVLGFLAHDIKKAGDRDALLDLEQLQDLCEVMDREAALPLQGPDLAPSIGRLVAQYCDLVDRATERLVAEGSADVQGLRTRGVKATYGRYLKLKNCGCCLCFDPNLWWKASETPVWLFVKNPSWALSPDLKEDLASLLRATPPEADIIDGQIVIPIRLPLQADNERVIASVVDQVRRVHGMLRDREAPSSPPVDVELEVG